MIHPDRSIRQAAHRLKIMRNENNGDALMLELLNAPDAALPEEEIEALKRGLEQGLRAEPHPYLSVGRRVRVKRGPLAGLEGILLRWKGNWRVVLSLELIQRSVSVDMDASDVEPAIDRR